MERRVGEWTLVRELARGGMGVVWLGQDRDGREVAIKVLEGAGVAPEAAERFCREGRVLSLLRHPNIVAVHGSGEVNGLPFIAMDYVPGGSLADRLKREGKVPQVEAALIAARLARALEHAHRHGVLHRDVKPQNVLLGRDGEPLLTDFGLAWDARDHRLTASGTVGGTPAYMSPEQADGMAGLDGRADVYSLGATLFHLLTGRAPFQGSGNMQLIAALVSAPAPRASTLAPGLHPDLDAIVDRCLAKEPAGRPVSAGALADALEGWLAGRGRSEAPRARSRVPWIVSVAVLGLGGIAVGGILLTPRASSVPGPTSTSPTHSVVAAAPSTALATEPTTEARLEELSRRGTELLARDEYPAALQLGEEAVQIAPDSPFARHLRAEARRCLRDYRGALVDLDRAVALRPDTSTFLSSRGLVRAYLGDLAGGLEDLGRAAELDPRSWRVRFNRADAHWVAGDRASALSELDAAVELSDTSEVEPLRARADLRWDAEDVPGALEDLERAVQLDDRHAETWFRMGIAHGRLEQLRPALVALDRALELEPTHREARFERSRLHALMGDSPAALADARVAARDWPRDVRAANVLGTLLIESGELEEARRVLDRAVELDPRSVEVWQNTAIAALQVGDFERMLVAGEKVREIAPQLARGRYLRGVALGRLGRPGAREDLEAWLRVAPPGRDADNARAELAKLR